MMKNILAVDDEVEILELIRGYFQMRQCEISTSSDPEDAMKKIASANYSLVITDLKFPGKYSGMDVLKAAKKRNPNSEVIIITGYGTIENAVEAMRLGAYDYVTKPFKIEELCIKAKRVMEMQELKSALDQEHNDLVEIEETAGGNIGSLEWDLQGLEIKVKKASVELKNLLAKLKKDNPAHDDIKAIYEELVKKDE